MREGKPERGESDKHREYNNNKETMAEEKDAEEGKGRESRGDRKSRLNKSDFCLLSLLNILCEHEMTCVHLTKSASGTHLYIHLPPLSHLLSLLIIFSQQHIYPFPLWVSVLHYWNNNFLFFFFLIFCTAVQWCMCVHFLFPSANFLMFLFFFFCHKMFHNAWSYILQRFSQTFNTTW